MRHLGVAQLVARDLGVVEAASSSLVTQTKIGSRKIPDFSLFISQILAKSRVFVINIMGLFFPASRVEQARFSPLTTCLTTYGDFYLFLWLFFGSFEAVITSCDYRLMIN